IAILLVDGEEQQAAASSSPQGGEVAAKPSFAAGEGAPTESHTPSPRPSPHRGEGGPAPVAKGETEQVMHEIAEQIRANGANGHGPRIFASPLARRLARERGIDLATIMGSGPHGRIIKADVERAASAPEAAKRAHAKPTEEAVPPTERAAEPRGQEVATRREPEAQGMSDQQVLALYE